MATRQAKLHLVGGEKDDDETAGGTTGTNLQHQAPMTALPVPMRILPVQGVSVLPARSAVNVSPIVPIQTLKYMTLKTQPPTSHQSKLFETYSDHIDVFLVEVYRCKLCKFHSAAKSSIASHMVEKHIIKISNTSDSAAATSTTYTCNTANSSGSGTNVSSEEPALTTVVHVNQIRNVTSNNMSSTTNFQTGANPPVVTQPASISGSGMTRPVVTMSVHQPIAMNASTSTTQISNTLAENDLLNKSHPITSAVNALELLMGISSKVDPAISNPKVTAPVPASLNMHLNVHLNEEHVSQNLPTNAVVPEPVCMLDTDLMGTLEIKTSCPKRGGLTTVDNSVQLSDELLNIYKSRHLPNSEEELAKTLEIDEKKESGDDESDGEEDDDEESDHGKEELIPEDITQTTPVPFELGLSQIRNLDIQEIANTASKSNPRATMITVLHHGQGDDPPTAIQFRKSKRSQAVIPTGESLGIASPFGQRPYRGNKKFECEKCGARYKLLTELERHTQKKHQRLREFLCEICGEALATRAGVKYHLSKKHTHIKQIFQCSDCDYSTSYEARIAIHRGTHDSNFYCELCEKKFVSGERLTKHYSSPLHKNALNPLVCEHCGYSTKKKDNFVVHMRKHTGEKPYKCKICGYASSDGSTLKKHVMAKHSRIRPFKCAMCTFSCVDKKGLDIHIRKHTGERPFKCQYCQYAAKRRSALNIHLQTHNKDSLPVSRVPEKSSSGQSTVDAVVEAVGQIGQMSQHTPQHTSQQTPIQIPQQDRQYTTMSNYQPQPISTQAQMLRQSGASTLKTSTPIPIRIETAYSVQLRTGSVAKPVQTVWQNM